MKAVIQCGGEGTRQTSCTMALPKPLMPVGTQSVLEVLLKWLRRNDVKDVYITTGCLGHLIKSYCGDGRQWDLNISYVAEEEPLGTIGSLGMLREALTSTFLVINGDVLTDLCVGDFTRFHRRRGGAVTVATIYRETRVDFGVIEVSDARITDFKEKPILSNLVNMGIYCIEPTVFKYIPVGVPFGFDDLILCLLGRGIPTHSFVHEGIWLDVGGIGDFECAQEIAWDAQSPELVRIAEENRTGSAPSAPRLRVLARRTGTGPISR